MYKVSNFVLFHFEAILMHFGGYSNLKSIAIMYQGFFKVQ